MGRIILVVMNVAQVYYRVCPFAKVCLVINCQMAIYGHPPRTGNGGDWVFVSLSQCLCHSSVGRKGSLLCSDVPLGAESEILPLIFKHV